MCMMMREMVVTTTLDPGDANCPAGGLMILRGAKHLYGLGEESTTENDGS